MIKNTPKPKFAVIYEQKDITSAITPFLLEITYTDYLSDQSDEITLTLEDVNGDWLYDWYPDVGDGVELSLSDDVGELVALGRFEIGEIEYRYPPSVVVLKALSTGIRKANREWVRSTYDSTKPAKYHLIGAIFGLSGLMNIDKYVKRFYCSQWCGFVINLPKSAWRSPNHLFRHITRHSKEK